MQQRTYRIIGMDCAEEVNAISVKTVFMMLALLQGATLWMAIAADMGNSIMVIGNALRLLGEGREHDA